MTARLKTAPEKVSVSDLKLRLGDSDLAGHADVTFKDPRPMISGKLSARRLDLQQLLATENQRQGERGANNTAGQKKAKVFPDIPLALDGLRAVDAAIELQAAEIKTPRLTLRDVATTATLAAGRLSLEPLRLVVAGSAVSGTAILDASKKVPALKLSVDAPRLDVGTLLKETGTSDMLEGMATFRVDVAGSGPSVAAIMAGLNGETRLLMNKGRMRTQAFDIAVGGLSAVMGGLFSDKQEWTVLNCAASKFDIAKGVAVSKVMLVDAEYSTVTGTGRIDLGKETLDLKVTPESKSATLNLAVPVIIGGTLLAPTFRPDETATAQRIGGLLAGTVFPPAALLSLADLGSGEEHPCLELAAGSGKRPASKSTVDKATQAVKDATDTTTRAVKDAAGTASDAAKGAVDSVTKGIKSLFGKD
jgi:uncharacterized protein involved in outer membrane biogenesis